MLSETQLKEKLEIISQDKFRLPQSDLSLLIPDMLYHIGSTDGMLRDDLIYSAFGTWIYKNNIIDLDQLRDILVKVLDEEHMLYKIGEQNTDSVFRRAFSVLLLPLLLIRHRSQPFLTSAEVHQIKEKLFFYLTNERDVRGFVSEKGWAHSIAHASDALDDLVQCVELQKNDLLEALAVVHDVICIKNAGYSHLEEERIITAVLAAFRRQFFSDEEITQWIQSFSDFALTVNSMPEKIIIRANIKNFLQSLYFRLQWELKTDKYNNAINQALRSINMYAPNETS